MHRLLPLWLRFFRLDLRHIVVMNSRASFARQALRELRRLANAQPPGSKYDASARRDRDLRWERGGELRVGRPLSRRRPHRGPNSCLRPIRGLAEHAEAQPLRGLRFTAVLLWASLRQALRRRERRSGQQPTPERGVDDPCEAAPNLLRSGWRTQSREGVPPSSIRATIPKELCFTESCARTSRASSPPHPSRAHRRAARRRSRRRDDRDVLHVLERLEATLAGGVRILAPRVRVCISPFTDPRHVQPCATVLEESARGVGQVIVRRRAHPRERAQAAEDALEPGEAGEQLGWPVRRTLASRSDEAGGSSTHPLDALRPEARLLDEDTGRKILGHLVPPLRDRTAANKTAQRSHARKLDLADRAAVSLRHRVNRV